VHSQAAQAAVAAQQQAGAEAAGRQLAALAAIAQAVAAHEAAFETSSSGSMAPAGLAPSTAGWAPHRQHLPPPQRPDTPPALFDNPAYESTAAAAASSTGSTSGGSSQRRARLPRLAAGTAAAAPRAYQSTLQPASLPQAPAAGCQGSESASSSELGSGGTHNGSGGAGRHLFSVVDNVRRCLAEAALRDAAAASRIHQLQRQVPAGCIPIGTEAYV
jgi:hypothetical protein